MMRVPPSGAAAELSAREWDRSKVEFWTMVKDRIDQRAQTVLYAGCGYDSRSREIQKHDRLVVNFDIVFEMLEAQKNRFGADACVSGDILRLPFKKGVFDAIVCIDVLHHESDNLLALLTSFRDLLRPGGRLFLEDVNAWGLFQFPKSILLPRPLYRFLRAQYHRARRSPQRPADYEFPTSPRKVERILQGLGFEDIEFHESRAYPCIPPPLFNLYSLLSRFSQIRRFHNFHYTLSASKCGRA